MIANLTMKQILIIHGGTCFDSRRDYLDYLKKRTVDLEKFRVRNDWKENLAYELKGEYDVLLPKMPCKERSRYEDWSVWFKRITDACDSPVILVGHSLGALFIVKYLSENSIKISIEKTALVATPFDESGLHESLADFSPPSSFFKLKEQAGEIYLIHSEDDPVVPIGHLDKYKKALPEAKILRFKEKGHFNQATFPELMEFIK